MGWWIGQKVLCTTILFMIDWSEGPLIATQGSVGESAESPVEIQICHEMYKSDDYNNL